MEIYSVSGVGVHLMSGVELVGEEYLVDGVHSVDEVL